MTASAPHPAARGITHEPLVVGHRHETIGRGRIDGPCRACHGRSGRSSRAGIPDPTEVAVLVEDATLGLRHEQRPGIGAENEVVIFVPGGWPGRHSPARGQVEHINVRLATFDSVGSHYPAVGSGRDESAATDRLSVLPACGRVQLQ